MNTINVKEMKKAELRVNLCTYLLYSIIFWKITEYKYSKQIYNIYPIKVTFYECLFEDTFFY